MSVAAKADAVSDHFDHLVGRGEDLTEHRLWSRPAQLAAPLNFCVSAPTQSSASAPEQSSNRSRAARHFPPEIGTRRSRRAHREAKGLAHIFF